MANKASLLQKTAWFIGIFALIGGILIFLVWAGARFFAAINYDSLIVFGLGWIFVFSILCLFALCMLFISILQNKKNFNRKALYTFLLIMINIPAVFAIMILYFEIDKYAFVKLTNHTGEDIVKIDLYARNYSLKLNGVNKNDSRVIYYNYNEQFVVQSYNMNMILYYKSHIDTVSFPKTIFGCKHYLIE